MITLSLPLDLAGALLGAPAASGNSSHSVSSVAQQFTGMLEQLLGLPGSSTVGSSGTGSQIEININSAPAPGSSGPRGGLMLKETPGAAAASSSSSATAPAVSSPADSSGTVMPDSGPVSGVGGGLGRSGAGTASNPPPIWSMFPGFGPDTILSSTPAPPSTAPAPPDFYEAPPTQSVINSAGNAVKTLDSYMQEQLQMIERGGTAEMMKGADGWDLQSLVDSFYLQAKSLAIDAGNISNPNIVPANWQQVTQNYANQYVQWLSNTDASYWDPQLSGPIYNPSTGVLQTPNGPVTVNLQPANSAAVVTS